MRLRHLLGLRPRLLLALAATAVLTLAAAALALLPPLQDRLRTNSARELQTTVLGARDELRHTVGRSCLDMYEAGFELGVRANAQVLITKGPKPESLRCVSPYRSFVADADIQKVMNEPDPRPLRVIDGDQVRLIVPFGQDVAIPSPNRDPAHGVRVPYLAIVTKQLNDVTATVHQVARAFLIAALIGLAVAALLGLALSATLVRRLGRLRRAVLRVMREGAGAPRPTDDGHDEVGDLARSFAAMQEALLRQEEARRAFVATASHELRTPLTSLQGMLELLDEDLREGRLDLADAQEQVAAAQRELRRMGNLATELLDLSRLDAGTELRSEPVELGELCRAVAAEFALRAEEAEVELDVRLPRAPCWARGDPGAIAQILRILVDNALRYSPGGAIVRVEAGYRGERAFLAVSDTGPGVPPAERELIFERFQRGSRTAGAGGFGLGLAIGRELAERLGGTLTLAESDSEPGARFICELPIELPAGGSAEGTEDPSTTGVA
ncbi:MAG TPA: HAMP domain-containing sensor histidine kinase [Solirubrobacteraceae bacterium]|jgi:signal transduction histidine kinase|nr:HAMP domain-containing sensor histidine kinase [Solirubrobacteraceae bacterium]